MATREETGQVFSPSQQVSAIAIGGVAVSMPGLQPMLLGALLSQGRIDAATLGHTATIEAFVMVLVTALAGAWMPLTRTRLITACALIVVIAANVATAALPPGLIGWTRGVASLGNGVLAATFLAMLARSKIPARLYAIFFVVNAAFVFLLSCLLSTILIPRYGATAGYDLLCGVDALLLLTTRGLPDHFASLSQHTQTRLPPRDGIIALFGVMLFLGGIMAFWIYVIPLGVQSGIPVGTMRLLVSAATGVQIVAGLAAIGLANRMSGIAVTLGTSLVGVIAIALMLASARWFIWVPAMLVFTSIWAFGPPFHVAVTLTADPRRRAAIFVGTAQLLGIAIGPLLASATVSASDFRPAAYLGAACLSVTAFIAAWGNRHWNGTGHA